MSIRKVSFASDEFYHLYNRGNSKQIIFHDEQDYKRFIGLLHVCNQEENFKSDNLLKSVNLLSLDVRRKLVAVGAWVLMPNHFHILITENIDGGISKFMQKLSTAYSMYYNKRYSRTGSLFEGKFKAQHLDKDNYLKYIFSYIHLNPIKLIQKDWKEKGIKNRKDAFKFLESYRYSSYLDFLGTDRLELKILNIEKYPRYFNNRKEFNKEIIEWLSYKD